MRAMVSDPRNTEALKIMGVIPAGRGLLLRAPLLCSIFEMDPLTRRLCTASPSLKQGGIEPEQKHFRSVMETEAPEDLHGLGTNGL